MTTDSTILPPSIDPETKKIGIRSVKAVNMATSRTECQIRDYPILATDEPDTLGGSNTAPTPLETTLASLLGCDAAILNRVADAMGFDYAKVELECSSQIDIRGSEGVRGIRPYFETLELSIVVYTDEDDKRFNQLVKNVELRCPVMNLFKAAQVEMDVQWSKRPKAEA